MQTYFLGCDVSKGYADFIVLDAHKRGIEPSFQLDDTFDGHNRLYQFLKDFFAKRPTASLHAAVESTGGYENNWMQAMLRFKQDFNLRIARLNPKGVNHHGKASFNRVVTDQVSARSIAEYLIVHPENVHYETDGALGSLRRKWKFIISLTKQKTRLLNQLEKLLYIANPQLLFYCKDGVSQWILKLLELYPTAALLANASAEEVQKIPYVTAKRAFELIEQAQRSIASASDAVTQDTISTIAAEILHLERLINKQIALLEKEKSLPEIELIKSVTSIGTASAVGLLTSMGSVERYPTSKNLAAYWGVHPKFKTSGDGASCVRMSKEGRGDARAILYMVAINAIIHNPLIREVYHNNLKKGKCKMDAIGVCMHKITRVLYGILKNKTPFDPEIDRQNRMMALPKKSATSTDKSRRFQKPDKKAPISRRQSTKRKEQKMSQDEAMSSNTRSIPCPSCVVIDQSRDS